MINIDTSITEKTSLKSMIISAAIKIRKKCTLEFTSTLLRVFYLSIVVSYHRHIKKNIKNIKTFNHTHYLEVFFSLHILFEFWRVKWLKMKVILSPTLMMQCTLSIMRYSLLRSITYDQELSLSKKLVQKVQVLHLTFIK